MVNGHAPFTPGTVTFPEIFAAAGYQTVNYGKWHTPEHPIWQESEDHRHFRQYSAIRGLGEGYDPVEFGVVQEPNTKLILGGAYPGGEDNPSKRITDLGIDFLRDRGADGPFMLRVSHLWPHTPVLPPAPFDKLYSPDDIPIRYFDEEAFNGRSHRDREWSGRFRYRNMPKADYAKTWTSYMGLCAYVDQQVGRLLNALNETGLADNTIIVYSADHGRALGEYGAPEKHTFDDAVWRVPFIFAFPGRIPEGETRDDLCGLIDTGKTLVGLAGLEEELPDHWRGRELFNDPIPPVSEQAAFGQIGFPDDAVGAGVIHQRKNKGHANFGEAMRIGVRTNRHRLDVTWMRGGERLDGDDLDGQMYDMENDPLERNNLFNDPDHQDVAGDLLNRIAAWFDSLDKPPALFPKKS